MTQQCTASKTMPDLLFCSLFFCREVYRSHGEHTLYYDRTCFGARLSFGHQRKRLVQEKTRKNGSRKCVRWNHLWYSGQTKGRLLCPTRCLAGKYAKDHWLDCARASITWPNNIVLFCALVYRKMRRLFIGLFVVICLLLLWRWTAAEKFYEVGAKGYLHQLGGSDHRRCLRETDRHGGGYLMEPHSRDGHMFTPGLYPCKQPCITDHTIYPPGYPRNLREMGPREWFREPEEKPWESWWQWQPRGQHDRTIFKFGYGVS